VGALKVDRHKSALAAFRESSGADLLALNPMEDLKASAGQLTAFANIVHRTANRAARSAADLSQLLHAP
jgi:hypothetical protein